MKIEKVEVENFKCFKHIKLDLKNFNVIIGKNASGKSNIINIIKFIKDMLMYSVDEAIDLQGGINYLCNSTINNKKPVKIRFTINTFDNQTFSRIRYASKKTNIIMIEKYEIIIAIQQNKQGMGYKVIENIANISYVKLNPKKDVKDDDLEVLDLKDYKITERMVQKCYVKDKKICEEFSNNFLKDRKYLYEPNTNLGFLRTGNANEEISLLVNYIPAIKLFELTGKENVKIYDFNPKNLKSASIINKQNILEEDGSNIANVIQRILKNGQEKRKLLMILKRLMPFIEDISTVKSFNKSMYFKVKETNKNDLPSELLSDGTVNIIAIIVALYFEQNNDVIIIEEPEKNIHPKLTNQLVNLMKDVGNKKQIIITTHNTQLLSSVKLNDLVYVYRNKRMYADVMRPHYNKNVKELIKNDLEVEDLFYEGLFTEREV